MKALIQRVTRASVSIDGAQTAAIGRGMLVLLGVQRDDTPAAAEYLAQRTANLRMFDDANGVPNINVTDANGEALVVSQFTLCADTRKGNRPSFIDAADPAVAEQLYLSYVDHLRAIIGAARVQTGVFRAMMNVELVNEGPYTLMIESK